MKCIAYWCWHAAYTKYNYLMLYSTFWEKGFFWQDSPMTQLVARAFCNSFGWIPNRSLTAIEHWIPPTTQCDRHSAHLSPPGQPPAQAQHRVGDNCIIHQTPRQLSGPLSPNIIYFPYTKPTSKQDTSYKIYTKAYMNYSEYRWLHHVYTGSILVL